MGSQTEEVTSQPAPKRRTVLWGLLGAVALAAALIALDVLLCYLLIPYGGETEAIWWRYRQLREGEIDTVIVGSSYAMQCIDPELVDERLGSSTYSLATPNQTPTASLIALKDAYEDHHIRRAIVGVSIESAQNAHVGLAYNVAFALGEAQGRSLWHAANTYLNTVLGDGRLGQAESLVALVPWTAWNVGFSPAAVRENMDHRRTMTPPEVSESRRLPVSARGHAPSYGHVWGQSIARHAAAAVDGDYRFDEELLERFGDICRYCDAHDIELYFVTIPWLDYLLVRYERPGGYAMAIKPFVDEMSAQGATFLDCTLLRPEYYHPELTDFANEQHLNPDGTERFSPVLGDLIARIEAGEDVAPLFYAHTQEDWDEYLSRVGRITISTFWAEVREGAIDLTMKSFYGTDIGEIEYEVTREVGEDSYEVLRPYAVDETFTIPTEGHGEMTILVNARQVGSESESERFCKRTILF